MDYREISDYDKLKNIFIDIGVVFYNASFDDNSRALVVETTLETTNGIWFHFHSDGDFNFVTK